MADGSDLKVSTTNSPSTQAQDARNQAINPPMGGAPAPKLDNTHGWGKAGGK